MLNLNNLGSIGSLGRQGQNVRSFSPFQLPDLRLWVDASDSASITVTSDSDVDSWADKSQTGLLFEQSSASLKPHNNATVNGLTAVLFDGSDDILSESATPFIGMLGYAFMVVQIPSALPTTNGNIVACGNPGVGTIFWSPLRYNYNTPDLFFGISARSGSTVITILGTTTPIVADTTYFVEVESDGATFTMWVNGIAQTLSVSSGSNNGWWGGDIASLTNISLGDLIISGGAANGKVKLCEAGITDGSIPNAALKTSLRNYVKAKWGVVI